MAFLFSTCRTNFDQRTNRNFMIVPIPRTFTLDTLQRLPPTSRGTISSQIFHAKFDILIRKKKRKILLKFEKEIFDLDERRRTTLRIGGDLSSIPPPPFTLLDNKGESKPRLLDQAFREQHFFSSPYSSTPLEKLVKFASDTSFMFMRLRSFSQGGGSVLPFNFQRDFRDDSSKISWVKQAYVTFLSRYAY